jgi:hypothetical protein
MRILREINDATLFCEEGLSMLFANSQKVG